MRSNKNNDALNLVGRLSFSLDPFSGLFGSLLKQRREQKPSASVEVETHQEFEHLYVWWFQAAGRIKSQSRRT